MIKEFLELGEIVGTHGVRGELRLNPWTDSPEFVKQFKTLYLDGMGERAVRVVSARPHGNVVILKLNGVDTVDDASRLRGRTVYMKRADAKIPEGSYFIAELTGCEVRDADSPEKIYGTLTDVSATGANDVWHITDAGGREYLIPAIPDVVVNTDVASGTILIRPLRGIFDDED
ncbi:MAG: 16S rRNA processing protein RimM [Clostridia bacterium]|nr:16S rRNA processing protein RimM [Clostridia bacterium]